MKNRKINLRIWMLVKNVPAVALFIHYCISVRSDYSSFDSYVQYLPIALIIISLLLMRKKRDVFDESARAILNKTDAMCMKLFYGYYGFLILTATRIAGDATTIGYFIAGGIVIITLVRTITFCVIDNRGMM